MKRENLKEKMTEIYLDNHTTTPIDPKVLEEMEPYFKDKWGNYLQLHKKGSELVPSLHQAYRKIYDLLGADIKEDRILFTSSNEEAISHLFHIVYKNAVQKQGKNHFLTLKTEDASILMNTKKMEDYGCKTYFLPQDSNGLIEVEKIAETITPRCCLVSLTLASGMSGLLQPIEELKELCKLRGIYLHLDVSYAVGKLELNIEDLGADFITFGGDKFHGPKSSGALYVAPGIAIEPLICGGVEQQGLRGGVLDTAAVVGLGIACELAQKNLSEMCLETASLRDLLERYLEEGLDDIFILFDQNIRLPNVSVISFKGVVADALLHALNSRAVYASIGGGPFQKLSMLLNAIGAKPQIANGALSFSLSRFNSAEEIKIAADIIIEEVKKLRKLSEVLKRQNELREVN